MKKFILLIAIILVQGAAYAQKNTQSLLTQYLKIKDALVLGRSDQARDAAKELIKELESQSSFTEKEILIKASKSISTQENIEKQRIAFAELSEKMWSVVKNAQGLSQDVYYQYCPMKKSYWLSLEKAIKNPYYGSKMLTCGNIASQKNK